MVLCLRNFFSRFPKCGKLLPKPLFPFHQIKYLNFSTSSNMATQQLLQIGQYTVNYEKVGNANTVVLCLPGALGFIESDFSPQLKMLKDKYTLVALDPQGYGKSRPPDRDFCGGSKFFYRDAEVAHELMKKLGYDQKYSILGWSDGGITALIQASLFPESVDKLIVWGANAYVDKTDVEAYKLVKDINNWSERMRAPMIQMYGEEYFRKTWETWVDTFLDIYKNGGDLCKESLSKIRCDTLIVHGSLDTMVHLGHAEYLHKHIKGSKFHLIKNAKHNLHLHPKFQQEFNSLVKTFIN